MRWERECLRMTESTSVVKEWCGHTLPVSFHLTKLSHRLPDPLIQMMPLLIYVKEPHPTKAITTSYAHNCIRMN